MLYEVITVEYISRILSLDVRVETVAEIRLNAQKGIAVVTGEVEVQPGFISYKGRTVTLTPATEDGGVRYSIENDTPRSMVDVHGPYESGGVGRRSLRITSYNVCYTKLLRLRNHLFHLIINL